MVCGQEENYNEYLFDHYGPKEGFNSGQALCMDKDSKGFLWIGTEAGLVRFDGHKFKKWIHEVGIENSLPENYIRNIKIDGRDRIWIDAGGKLSIYDIKENKFYNKSFNYVNKSAITFTYQKEKETMWLCTAHGLFFSSIKNDIKLNQYVINEIPTKDFHSFNIDMDGKFWLGTSIGYYHFDPKIKKANHFSLFNKDKKSHEGIVTSFIQDSTLWIGTWGRGLIKINVKDYSFKVYKWSKTKIFFNAVLKILNNPDDKNKLWLNTNEGILLFDIKKESFINFNKLEKTEGGGFGLLNDEFGTWFGSDKGLFKLDKIKQFVTSLDLQLGPKYERQEINKFSIIKGVEKDSLVIIHFNYGDIVQYDLHKKKLIELPYLAKKYITQDAGIWTFLVLKNNIIVCTKKYGVVSINIKENSVQEFKFKDGIFKELIDVSIDNNGVLHFGSFEGTFYLNEEKEIVSLNLVNDFLKKNHSNTIYAPIEDHDGNFWYIVEHIEGDYVIMYNKKENKVQAFNPKNTKEIAILNEIDNMILSEKGTLIIASFNGLCIVKPNKGKPVFTSVQKYNSIVLGGSANLQTSSNTVWASTDYGLMWYNFVSDVLINFSYYNSKIGKQIQPALCLSPANGHLYIAQKGRFDIVNPFSYKKLLPDSLKISELKINNKNISPTPSNNEILKLNSYDRGIEISLTHLNFSNTEESIYFYRDLNDTIWKKIIGNTIKFEQLSEGESEYEFKAINGIGRSCVNNLNIKFDVDPVFYRRWWFYFLVLGIISSFIFSVFRYREIQRIKLEQLRYNIARDLHDDMGSNLSQIKMMSELAAIKDKNKASLEISKKLEDVMENMNEIVWSINPNYDKIEDVILRIQEFAIQVLEPMDIKVKFKIEDLSKGRILNQENKRHFYLIFKEGINNIAKYSKASEVVFSVQDINGSILASLTDNGVGFNPLLVRRGNGLINMENRAKYLNAKLDINTSSIGTEISLVVK